MAETMAQIDQQTLHLAAVKARLEHIRHELDEASLVRFYNHDLNNLLGTFDLTDLAPHLKTQLSEFLKHHSDTNDKLHSFNVLFAEQFPTHLSRGARRTNTEALPRLVTTLAHSVDFLSATSDAESRRQYEQLLACKIPVKDFANLFNIITDKIHVSSDRQSPLNGVETTIMWNLINNALNYSRGTPIEITCSEGSSFAVTNKSDTPLPFDSVALRRRTNGDGHHFSFGLVISSLYAESAGKNLAMYQRQMPVSNGQSPYEITFGVV